MIRQPGHVVETLVDHPCVGAALVLDDHRGPILIEAQRVDPSAVDAVDDVLAREERDAQHRLHVRLDKILHIRLDRSKMRAHFLDTTCCLEQLQDRHSPFMISVPHENSTERRDISAATAPFVRARLA